jgi:hypothetical protein
MRNVWLLIIVCFFGSGVFADGRKIIVEAEKFTKEQGGKLKNYEGRPETSGNACMTTWNDKDHAVEWVVDVPENGKYKVVLRYANGRAWTVYRDFKIDGAYPSEAFKKIAMPETGGFAKNKNDWKNLTVLDAKKMPALVALTKGKHTIRMNNLGGDDDQDGASNFDAIGFLDESVDASVLGK